PEKSNLLIVRSGVPCPPGSPPAPRRRSLHQMMFHKIDPQSLTRGESLGQGSFTQIYKGVKHEQDEEDGPRQTPVVLKVMDSSHQNCLESFLEAASTMSQLSHKHLVLLHGVSLGKDSVMVQEHVWHGPLDLYLRKNRGAVTTGWKLTVAKQLAYALNYLEDKKIPHGNVSAKKVLLAREGDGAGGSPPFIKLNDPGVSVTVLAPDMLLQRIPWVAPECVSDPGSLALPADKWGFGATLWEIFSGGNMPLSLLEPQRGHPRVTQGSLSSQVLSLLVAVAVSELEQCHGSAKGHSRVTQRSLSSQDDPLEMVTQRSLSSPGNAAGSCPCQQLCPGWSSAMGHPRVTQGSAKGHCPARSHPCSWLWLYQSQSSAMGHSRVTQGSPKGHPRVTAHPGGHCWLPPLPAAPPRPELSLPVPPGCDPAPGPCPAPLPPQGMEYLGARRCVHRDLASRNILVESHSHVKIGDFGLAKLLPQDKEYYVVREPGQSPVFWYAPESLADNIFSCSSDTWSFGVLLYELFTYSSKSRSPSEEFLRMMGTGRPAQIICQLLELLKDNRRLPVPAGCPAEV
ncbi:JAK3 kinase, partial [Copsychus sechellarum]|nr:JAK3 kinase [Copsychus sechellarum]